MSFQLTDQNDTLVLDLAGNVTKDGAPVGGWTVTKDNQIEVNQADGGTRTIPVKWSFNANNELRSFGDFAPERVAPAGQQKSRGSQKPEFAQPSQHVFSCKACLTR
jgi:hypothetical protein